METFYAILYVSLKVEAKEKLALGLFMRNEENIYFKYAKGKLDAIKLILPIDTFALLKLTLNNIDKEFKNAKEELEQNKIFNSNKFTASFFNHSNTYAKNLIYFSKNNKIDVALNDSTFANLFALYIDDNEKLIINENDATNLKNVKTKLLQKIKTNVNIDFELTKKHLNHLLLSKLKVDAIGKNGIYVISEFMDFNKPHNHLNNDFAKQIALSKAIADQNDKHKTFIVGNEPNKIEYPQKHNVWSNIHNSKEYDFIDTTETEKIEEHIKRNGVKPLELF